MRTVSLSWDKSGGRFVALGKHAGHTIALNAPNESGGESAPTGFSPSELLLAGAGACAAWDVLEILRKRRTRIDALEVTVEGHQGADPPWTYGRVALHFRVTGEGLRPPVVARIVRLSVVRYCSVISTISGVAAIEATAELLASDGSTSGRRPIELAIPAVSPAVVHEPASDGDAPPAGS